MSAHTKGPWSARIDETVTIRDDHDNQLGIITHIHTKNGGRRDADEVAANARRIVACVNACEGIETDFLESGSLIRGVGLYVEQNNELLDICRNVVERGIGASDIDAMKTALAKAEGKK